MYIISGCLENKNSYIVPIRLLLGSSNYGYKFLSKFLIRSYIAKYNINVNKTAHYFR